MRLDYDSWLYEGPGGPHDDAPPLCDCGDVMDDDEAEAGECHDCTVRRKREEWRTMIPADQTPPSPAPQHDAVHGSVRWLTSPVGEPDALIEINGTTYRLTYTDGDGLYQLQRWGAAEPYTVDLAHATCTCGDKTYRPGRPGGCKHCAALRALLTTVHF